MAASPDTLPSGSWSLGPLTVTWSLKSGNEVDVTFSVLGIDIDTLSGTLNNQDFEVKDNINLLGLVTGTIGLKAVYGGAPGTNGLHIEGRLQGPGFDTGDMDFIIIPW